MVERHAVITLLERGVLTHAQAAQELGLSGRQVRRLVGRYRAAHGDVAALAYQRRHPAPNRLPPGVREEVLRLHATYPHWSAPAISEAVAATQGWRVHRSTVYRLLRQEAGQRMPRQRRAAKRFEMGAFGVLWQMDTTSGAWLVGERRVYAVAILDDYSRALVACRLFLSDSSYHNLLVLREAMERYGRPQVLYTDNDSKFRITRYQHSRFYVYRQETLEGLVPTEVHRALQELDVHLLSHYPGNAQAKGKIERFFRFLQERVLRHHQAQTLGQLQALVDRWVAWYNRHHVNRDVGKTPAERLTPSVARPLPTQPHLDDIFCLKEERKVAKDGTIALDGVTYQLPAEPCLVAFKVQVHIHPGERVRILHHGQLVVELPHGDPRQRRNQPLTVEQVLEDILPATRERSF